MFANKDVLIIGTVWPEPKSTAAGARMMQLIKFFQEGEAEITFACSASNLEFSEDLESIGISTKQIKVNSSSFDDFIKALNPSVVLFDRFMTEEQFGWRVAENCPEAIKILDTEDLHSLRYARYEALKNKKEFNNEDIYTDLARREIASIYRCDLSLIISKFEFSLLQDVFKIDSDIFIYLPFMMNELNSSELSEFPSFDERKDFISIGNFLHEPNWDAVRYLKEEIWGLIRKEIPEAKLNIYGSYTSPKVEQLHNEKEGFLIKGRAETAKEVISESRILLAPLRFGAGLKGKLMDAMRYGTPSITTNIGAEGLSMNKEWGGAIENNPESFAKKAVQIYKNRTEWGNAQQIGVDLFNQLFDKIKHHLKLKDKIESIASDLSNHRSKNFIGSMLLQNTLQSYKYMSKWIEEKNKNL